MLTSLECIVKAEEMERRAIAYLNTQPGDDYADMARRWRRTATVAARHEKWEALHSIG